MTARRYVPALRWHALTAIYDPLVRAVTRERRFKRRLLERAGLRTGATVLDVGCGTGTLAIDLAQANPSGLTIGVDIDPGVLSRARSKSRARGINSGVRWLRATSIALPCHGAAFEHVFTTLTLHHLTTAEKAATFAELERVLRPGGNLLVADWHRPAGPMLAAVFVLTRLLDGFERTRANAEGRLPALMEDAGLIDVVRLERLDTIAGTLALFAARKPAGTESANEGTDR